MAVYILPSPYVVYMMQLFLIAWLINCIYFGFALRTNADDNDGLRFQAPNGIVALPDGSLLISDIQLHRLFRVELSGKQAGELQLWGGTGQPFFLGDETDVQQSAFHAPHDLKLDRSRNAVLVADTNNHRIRQVDLATKIVKTLAGSGRSEFSGDGGPAILAGLNNPQGIAVDSQGNILIADTYNHVVRRIATDGIITTVAGSTPGLSGDGGPATSAQLSLPMAVAFGSDDKSFFISEGGNSRIRRVSIEGIIETVCGIGEGSGEGGAGLSGDGDRATKAKIFSALDILPVSPNFFYISDSGNNRLRTVVHGTIMTVAGSASGKEIKPSDTKSAESKDSSELFVPAKLALAPQGGLYFCDRGNQSIRLLDSNGQIHTLVSGNAKALPTLASPNTDEGK